MKWALECKLSGSLLGDDCSRSWKKEPDAPRTLSSLIELLLRTGSKWVQKPHETLTITFIKSSPVMLSQFSSLQTILFRGMNCKVAGEDCWKTGFFNFSGPSNQTFCSRQCSHFSSTESCIRMKPSCQTGKLGWKCSQTQKTNLQSQNCPQKYFYFSFHYCLSQLLTFCWYLH